MSRFVFGFGLALASLMPLAAHAAGSFDSAVLAVLMGQKDGPVTELDNATKKKLAACVVTALDKAPEAKKRALAEAKGFDQQEDRFGEIVMADHAKLKQKITLDCGEIATAK